MIRCGFDRDKIWRHQEKVQEKVQEKNNDSNSNDTPSVSKGKSGQEKIASINNGPLLADDLSDIEEIAYKYLVNDDKEKNSLKTSKYKEFLLNDNHNTTGGLPVSVDDACEQDNPSNGSVDPSRADTSDMIEDDFDFEFDETELEVRLQKHNQMKKKKSHHKLSSWKILFFTTE